MSASTRKNTASSADSSSSDSVLNTEIVVIDKRKFRKQSRDCGQGKDGKIEARRNALTFAKDDGGWRNDAALRVEREKNMDDYAENCDA